MVRKIHKPEEIVAKLRQVDVLTAQGTPVEEAVRSIGVTEVTYYRWRQEYGGLKSDQVKRLKDLETENARLRKAVSDLTLDKLILQEAAKGNFQALHAAVPASSMSAIVCLSPSAGPVRRTDNTARRNARSHKVIRHASTKRSLWLRQPISFWDAVLSDDNECGGSCSR